MHMNIDRMHLQPGGRLLPRALFQSASVVFSFCAVIASLSCAATKAVAATSPPITLTERRHHNPITGVYSNTTPGTCTITACSDRAENEASGDELKMSMQSDSFQVQTDEQRKALAALRPMSGSVEFFGQLVLNLLHIISNADIYYHSKQQTVNAGSSYRVLPAKLREYRRAAKSAEKMADRLAKDAAKLRGFGFPRFEIPTPPVHELKMYANLLKEHADADRPYIARPQLRRKPNKSTNDIIALVRLVKLETGKPHWNRLATLVGAALGDNGFDEDRLRKMVKYQERRV